MLISVRFGLKKSTTSPRWGSVLKRIQRRGIRWRMCVGKGLTARGPEGTWRRRRCAARSSAYSRLRRSSRAFWTQTALLFGQKSKVCMAKRITQTCRCLNHLPLPFRCACGARARRLQPKHRFLVVICARACVGEREIHCEIVAELLDPSRKWIARQSGNEQCARGTCGSFSSNRRAHALKRQAHIYFNLQLLSFFYLFVCITFTKYTLIESNIFFKL